MTEIIQTCPSDLVITVDKWRVSRSSNEHEHRHVLSICPIWSPVELQTNHREDYAKFLIMEKALGTLPTVMWN